MIGIFPADELQQMQESFVVATQTWIMRLDLIFLPLTQSAFDVPLMDQDSSGGKYHHLMCHAIAPLDAVEVVGCWAL